MEGGHKFVGSASIFVWNFYTSCSHELFFTYPIENGTSDVFESCEDEELLKNVLFYLVRRGYL